jgi:hypothetical protein
MTLTAERLREVLDYDSDTGFFTWRETRSHAIAGVRAGHVNRCAKFPHRFIQVDGRGYQSGRLAWLHVYGEWPKRVFRVNADRLDDRIANLKPSAPVYRGARIPGVYQFCNKFTVSFRSKGKSIYVGCFDSFEAAKAALTAARREHKVPSKFFGAKWIYKVKQGWSVRVRLKRKGKQQHLGTFATLESAQTALARARAPKPKPEPKKHWWDDPGAMSPE